MAALSVGDGAPPAEGGKPKKEKKPKQPKPDKPKQVVLRLDGAGGGSCTEPAALLLHTGTPPAARAASCGRSTSNERAPRRAGLVRAAGRGQKREEEGDQAGADRQEGRRLWGVVLTGAALAPPGPGLGIAGRERSLAVCDCLRSRDSRARPPAEPAHALPARAQVVVESEMISYYDVSGALRPAAHAVPAAPATPCRCRPSTPYSAPPWRRLPFSCTFTASHAHLACASTCPPLCPTQAATSCAPTPLPSGMKSRTGLTLASRSWGCRCGARGGACVVPEGSGSCSSMQRHHADSSRRGGDGGARTAGCRGGAQHGESLPRPSSLSHPHPTSSSSSFFLPSPPLPPPPPPRTPTSRCSSLRMC